MKRYCREAGLTLLELMITVILFGLLATAVSAFWTPLMERVQAASVQSTIQRAFALTRSTAVQSGAPATLCPMNAGNQCTADWDLPVVIFIDPQSERRLTGNTRVIRQLPLAASGHITPSSTGRALRRYFQFRPDGASRGTLGHLTWCPKSEDPTRAIHVRMNLGGRPIWSTDTNGNDIVEKANGDDVRC